jgi:hypothetical protein
MQDAQAIDANDGWAAKKSPWRRAPFVDDGDAVEYREGIRLVVAVLVVQSATRRPCGA